MTTRNPIHISVGITALGCLKAWSAVFDTKEPYSVVAAIISGNQPDEDAVGYCRHMISEIDGSISDLGASEHGALSGAMLALKAVISAIDEPDNEQAVHNIASRVKTCLRVLK